MKSSHAYLFIKLFKSIAGRGAQKKTVKNKQAERKAKQNQLHVRTTILVGLAQQHEQKQFLLEHTASTKQGEYRILFLFQLMMEKLVGVL